MPVCNKCLIDKPQDEYYKEKRWGKIYYKRYCLECFRKQARDWKAKNRPKKRMDEELVQPIEKVQPEASNAILEVLEGHKVCTECNVMKPIDNFYKTRVNKLPFKRCKVCHNEFSKAAQKEAYKIRLMENGGSERVPPQPDTYSDEYQKAQTFWLLEFLGWTYNDNGVWSKEGVKDKFNNWKTFKPAEPKPVKVPRRVRINWAEKAHLVIEMRERGMIFEEIAKNMGCSKPTAIKVYNDYGKKKK